RSTKFVTATVLKAFLRDGLPARRTPAGGAVVRDNRTRGRHDGGRALLLGTSRRGQGGPHAQNQHERFPHRRLLGNCYQTPPPTPSPKRRGGDNRLCPLSVSERGWGGRGC